MMLSLEASICIGVLIGTTFLNWAPLVEGNWKGHWNWERGVEFPLDLTVREMEKVVIGKGQR